MPRYEYDPSKASATIEIFEKGDYEVIIGAPKSFAGKVEGDGPPKNWGVRFKLTIAEGPNRGKSTIFSGYLHNDGGASMTKRFQMAALGYGSKPEDEKRFDAEQAGKDWSFDPDTGAVGEAWGAFSGARVISIMDVGKNQNTGEPQQNFKAWRPIAA